MAPIQQYQIDFIERCISYNALLFGTFTLKSGRQSPYFFNAGQIYTGSLLASTSDAYAGVLSAKDSRIPPFDVLFGPAYKGIPLAAVTAVALSRDHETDVGFCYNRKEKKDHGEGGSLVGAPLEGRIVIIDDVLTSGTAIREAIQILSLYPKAKLVGIIQLVDRQEVGKGSSGKSTVQEIEEEYGVPVVPIIAMADIMAYCEKKGGMEKELEGLREYRDKYGVKA
ncbi:orotate phosphoribosyltransferase, partial [Tremellales sp. Uapishka_1]